MNAAPGRKGPRICPLSPAHLAGLTAFELSLLFLFVAPALAPLPLAGFVLACGVAAFCPRFRLFLPVIRRGPASRPFVAVTFDGGPDPDATPLILDRLAAASAPAAFFLAGAQAESHPAVVREILSRGHEIGNRSCGGGRLPALAPIGALRRAVASTQAALAGFGVRPLAYRPPGRIIRPGLWRILLEGGMFCVDSSLRGGAAGRAGGTGRGARLAARAVAGDIIALPGTVRAPRDAGALADEVEALVGGLRAKGLEIEALSRLIRKDVMRRTDGATGAHPVEVFYDGLAEAYDEEQFRTKVSISKRTENALVTARIPGLLAGADRVLEVGAGTGIFTMLLARHCREVVALDMSPRMLALLQRKARAEGLTNVRTLPGDAEEIEIPGIFSAVCAFVCLEYMADLPAFFRRLAPHVAPGGPLYFITARRSLFRLATQVGNAMRQGIWLKAHSRREIEAMLSAAGFENIEASSHLFRSWISGGMLLEVVARRARGPNV